MNTPIVSCDAPVLLLGGARVDKAVFRALLARCGAVVAADGGAATALDLGQMPDAVIGDMDSLPCAARAALPPDRLFPIASQDDTDFEKSLTRIAAPLVLGLGLTGRRIDHTLAALSVLVRHPARRCVLFGGEDVLMLCPPRLCLDLAPGTRLSLFPMAEVTGRSEGLEWPIAGLRFAPEGRIGTSNRVTGPVTLEMDRPGMILILPLQTSDRLLDALPRCDAIWPVPA